MRRRLCARCMKKSPAQTRHSLFASATVAPRSTAASAGFNPAAPLTAAITQSAGRAAASMIALSPAPHSMPRAGQRVSQSPSRPGSAIAANRAPNSFASFARPSTLVLAVRASIWYRSREAAQQIHGAVADRTGGTQDGHGTTADAAARCYATELHSSFSPNHKTVADAIHAATQNRKRPPAQPRRQNRRADRAIRHARE